MAITTVAGMRTGLLPPVSLQRLAGVAPGVTFLSYWRTTSAGDGQGALDTTLAGVALTGQNTLGAVRIPNPAASTENVIAKVVANIGTTGYVMLADRLWHNGGFTITSNTAQTVTSAAWPARDEDASTNGNGVLIGLEITATCGAATPTISIVYTNSAGTGSRAGTAIFTGPTAGSVSSFLPFSLDGGDVGVRSVQSMTLSVSWVSGTVNLVAFRPLAIIPCLGRTSSTNISIADLLSTQCVRVPTDAVVFPLCIPNGASATALNSFVYVAGG